MKPNIDNIRKHYISLPNAAEMPDIRQILATVPKEKEHRFESAGEFVKRLADRVVKWREMLPENLEPVIFAFLPGGEPVEVISIGEDGHSSVVIEGTLDEVPCMFVSHQASLQVLCYTREIKEEEEPEVKKRRIGFHVGGEKIDA